MQVESQGPYIVLQYSVLAQIELPGISQVGFCEGTTLLIVVLLYSLLISVTWYKYVYQISYMDNIDRVNVLHRFKIRCNQIPVCIFFSKPAGTESTTVLV